ncbi:phage replisome organizer N-terminal domain-containing protein [Bacillus thuringiensis]
MSNIKWIKLSTSMFEDEKIKLIESLPEADTILIIWIKLLSLAGKTNATGGVYLNENIPYTDEMLSTIFDRPLQTVRLALTTFVQYGMIEITDHNFIFISNWEKHQNIDGLERVRQLTAERNKKYRERKKQKQLALENHGKNSDACVTSYDGTDIDKELEEDKDIKNIKPSRLKYEIPDMENAKLLFQLMLENNENCKEPNLESWANEMRLMRERDKRTEEQIQYVIQWSQRDPFWKTNILSPSKLRKQFDQLVVRIREEKEKEEKEKKKKEAKQKGFDLSD